jgi:hypothetical protein
LSLNAPEFKNLKDWGPFNKEDVTPKPSLRGRTLFLFWCGKLLHFLLKQFIFTLYISTLHKRKFMWSDEENFDGWSNDYHGEMGNSIWET